jgi:hypothetical protein
MKVIGRKRWEDGALPVFSFAGFLWNMSNYIKIKIDHAAFLCSEK